MAVAATSDTVELRGHDVYVVIHTACSVVTPGTTILKDIGKLKYEFDVPDSGEDATGVGVKTGSLKVVVEDFLSGTSGVTLMDMMESCFSLTTVDDSNYLDWYVEFYFRTKGGSFGDPIYFIYDYRNIDFDSSTGHVTYDLQPYAEKDTLIHNTSIQTHLSSNGDYTITFTPSGTADALAAGEFVKDALHIMFEPVVAPVPSFTGVFKSGVFVDGNPATGTEWVMASEYDGGANLLSVKQGLGRCAALEGAIYGRALNELFYVNRKNTDNSVTLDFDNVEILKKQTFPAATYKELTVTHDTLSVSKDSSGSSANKLLTVNFDQSGLFLATINSASTCTETTFTNAVASEGRDNYGLAFSFDAKARLSLTHWGIDAVKVYNIITFDVDAPAIYQSKNFRISKAEYDWKNDKVELEIYEI